MSRDVLDVMADCIESAERIAADLPAHAHAGAALFVAHTKQARADVAQLITLAHRAEVSFNTVGGCYRRNPGNFSVAMQKLDEDVAPLRALLSRIGSPS